MLCDNGLVQRRLHSLYRYNLHFVTVVHAGNIADLDFGPVVAGTNALMLVSTHLDSVAQVMFDRCGDEVRRTELTPPEAFKQCAFFRVWCLVELAEALRSKKAVVMVVGKQSADGFCAIPGSLTLCDNTIAAHHH